MFSLGETEHMQICHAAVESGSCKNYLTLLYFIATIDWPLLCLTSIYLFGFNLWARLHFPPTVQIVYCWNTLLTIILTIIFTHTHATMRVLFTMFVIWHLLQWLWSNVLTCKMLGAAWGFYKWLFSLFSPKGHGADRGGREERSVLDSWV